MTNDSEATQTAQAMLRQARSFILDRSLFTLAGLVSVALALAFLYSLITNNITITFFIGPAISVGLIWLLVLGKRFMPYLVRAAAIMSVAYLAAWLGLFNTGLMGVFRYNLLATVILAAVFLGRRAAFVTTAVVTITALLGGYLVQQNIIIPNPLLTDQLLGGQTWLQETLRFSVLTILLISISFQLIRESELTFNRQQKLTQRLGEERQALDARIEERTRALRLTAEVSRTLVMILDKDQLVLEVVEQIQKTFNYYHVHIYLLDKENELLLMAGGTGEAGKALLIGKHRLPVGKGLVGRAALMGIPILVGDVSTDKYWLPNPLLPETRSEIAVPIIHENKVIGVLDVQDNTPNSLTERDVDLLETLGNQLGVALTNANLYQQRTEQAVRQAKLNEISNKIQFSADMQSAVQVAVREVGETLRVNRTSILLQPEKPEKPEKETAPTTTPQPKEAAV